MYGTLFYLWVLEDSVFLYSIEIDLNALKKDYVNALRSNETTTVENYTTNLEIVYLSKLSSFLYY